jgi:probable phosphoglycerate mutase
VTAEVATRLIAVRHGQTDWNQQARVQGHTDIALNAEGRTQAARLAGALVGEPLAAVYSSDLRRALDTARPLARACGASLATHAGLRERAFGRFEGLLLADIERRWPDAARRLQRRDPDYAPEEGETLREFHARCVATARELAAAHPGQAIVLVAHGGVLDSLYRAAAHVPLDAPRSWVVANASINRLLVSEGRFALVGWNDDAHLRADAPG